MALLIHMMQSSQLSSSQALSAESQSSQAVQMFKIALSMAGIESSVLLLIWLFPFS